MSQTFNIFFFKFLSSTFAVFDITEGVTGKFGCEIMDYEETILAPFIENVQKAEELRGLVSLSIDEQELFARADAGKSTIEKIKSREKLPYFRE